MTELQVEYQGTGWEVGAGKNITGERLLAKALVRKY